MLSEVKNHLQHIISAASSEPQLPDSRDADQAAEAGRSQDVRIYIPYDSAEVCITQVK